MKRTTKHLAVLLATLGIVGGAVQAQNGSAGSASQAQQQATQGSSGAQGPQATQKGQAAQRGQGTQQQGEKDLEAAGVLLLVPRQMTADPNLGNGCWIALYDRDNFQGESVTIVGPAAISDLDLLTRWGDPDSVIVGPKAQVTAYDNDNYRDHSANLLAGQRLSDLQAGQFGAFQDIESLRVACTS